jgi:hypothetical protein
MIRIRTAFSGDLKYSLTFARFFLEFVTRRWMGCDYVPADFMIITAGPAMA